MSDRPDRIAVCQHPNGEGLYVPLRPGEPSSPCFQDCDCTPVVYVIETGRDQDLQHTSTHEGDA